MGALSASLDIAGSGLAAVQRELALVSQNIANAGTAGYATETAAQSALVAGGQGMGVITQPAIAASDPALQAELLAQVSQVSGLATQQAALKPIDQVAGTPGTGNDLASQIGALQNSFTTLLTDPSNQAQQAAVVQAAQTVAGQLNGLGNATTTARQNAQTAIVSEVGTFNRTLTQIGGLNSQIVAMTAQHQSTADLVNQRNAAVQTLAQLVSVKTSLQPDGALLVATASGTILPTDGSQTVSTGNATLTPGSSTVPPITLGGVDITAALTGGQIGANIALRDTILPTRQAGLDEFAAALAQRFSAQGLKLFTDAVGNVPTAGVPVQSGYLGFANSVTVNPAVVATPSLVRDGTQAVVGSAGGASAFTPNPAGGPAGFATMISRVLNYALGADVQAGVVQPAANSSGLGASGTLSVDYGGSGSVAGLATAMTASQAAAVGDVAGQLSNAQAVQTGLQSQLQGETGVSVDNQLSTMIALQNSYGANAKVMTAVESMFTTLITAVTGIA